MFAQTFVAAATLSVMVYKKLVRSFCFVAAFLGICVANNAISIAMLFYRKEIGISKMLDYNIIFYTRWTCFFLLSGLILFIIHGIFSSAMKPLKGLHRAGTLIFRWIFAVSLAVCLGIAVGSHPTAGLYFQNLASQIQQATSILTLCLLLFVCFAIRHLGLTYRSHIFGISLGLGIMATVSLVESAFYTVADAQPLYSPVYLYSSLGACVALMVWGAYFAVPEPVRQMVLLPTTSPYFLWNSISEALGDSPGNVAIAGFKPDMLAPAELAVLSGASVAANRRYQIEAAAQEAAMPTQAVVTSVPRHTERPQPAFAMQS